MIRLLGRGGMGVVYEAVDNDDDTRVALKVLPLVSPERLLRFKREFRTVAELHHPNLVRLGELVGAGEHWFFSMELLHGLDVVSYVRGGRRLPAESTMRAAERGPDGVRRELDESPTAGVGHVLHEARARSTLGQLASALDTLHRHGCVHRDVTPANVMVTPEERVVLLDFGLSSGTVWESTQMAGGTAQFMAPEQAAGAPVNPAADWYAFGVVMYEILTGILPFSGTASHVLWVKQHHEAEPVLSINPGAPPDLAALCDALVRAAPAERPTGERVLRQLAPDRASEERLSGSAPGSERTQVIGRAAELQLLEATLAAVQRGAPSSVVVLRGESGIGKSTLVRSFVETVQGRGDAFVFQGRCYERELVPFKAVDGLFDALSHWLRHQTLLDAEQWMPRRGGVLAQVFPVLGRVEAFKRAVQPELTADRGEVRTWLFAAVRELFCNLSKVKSIVLFVDDLQWADSDSIALLTDLLTETRSLRLLLVATSRTHPSSHPASPERVFGGQVDEQHVLLGALSQEESIALARDLLSRGDATGPASLEGHATAERLAAESRGHPLFLRELARSAHQHAPPLLTLDEVFRTRARSLSESSARTLVVLAVAGVPLPRAVVSAAAQLEAAELPAVIHELRGARFALLSGERGAERLEISHDRVLRAIQSELSADALRGLHARLGSALEGSNDAFGAAVHFRSADEPVRAARHFARAGQMALSALAFADAIDHLQIALADGDWTADERCELSRSLADALANAGRGAAAAEHYLQAAELASISQCIGLRRRAAEELMRAGFLDQGLGVARDVLADAGLELARHPIAALLLERARVRLHGSRIHLRTDASAHELARIDLCWSMSSALVLTDNVHGAYFQSRGLMLALRSGDPYRVARSVATEGAYAAAMGHDKERVWTLLARARQIAEELEHPQALGTVSMMEGIAHHFFGCFAEAVAPLRAADEILRTRCTGAIWELDACRQFWLESTYYLGELRDFASTVSLGLREADERGAIFSATNLRTGVNNAAWLIADQPQRARRESSEAMERWSARGFHVQHWYDLLATVQTCLYEASPRAHTLLEERWFSLARSHLLRITHVRIAAHHLRGRAALCAAARQRPSERASLLRLARRCADKLAREKDRWCPALAGCLRVGADALSESPESHRSGQKALPVTLREAGLPLFEQALAVLVGDVGHVAQDRLAQQGVVRPDRWANMLIPGLCPP